MVRDFTEKTKERLSKEIDDINRETWCGLTDFIGDLFMYGGKWIGLLSLDDDMSNVESYQRKVLDMTDMTKSELEQIFEQVYAVDKQYKENISDIRERENVYNFKLQELCSMIKPGFSICDAGTIGSMVGAYNDRLRALDSEINNDFKAELSWAAKQAALENTKGFFSSVLNIAVDVFTLPVKMIENIVTGNYTGLFTDTWAIINDVFAVGGNLVGLTTLGLGYGISLITGNNGTKNMAIKYGEAYGGVSGLTDVLEAEEKINGEDSVTTWMLRGSKAIDLLSDAAGLFSDAKKFLKEPKKMFDGKFGFKFKLGELPKSDMLEKYQSNYRHWQALYRRLGKQYHYVDFSGLSTFYKYMGNFWSLKDGLLETDDVMFKTIVEESNKWFKALGDAYDFGDDLYNNMINPITEILQ